MPAGRSGARRGRAGTGRRGGKGEAALRFWEIVTLFPDISDPELQDRIDRFVMRASAEELLAMSRGLFDFAAPLLLEDERLRGMMAALSGKRVALVIEGEYHSVVTLSDRGFRVELGTDERAPAISVVDRRHYRDALLKRSDPVRLILERKIRVKGLATLARWGLPYLGLLRDRGLYDKYLGYQPEVEARVSDILASLGY